MSDQTGIRSLSLQLVTSTKPVKEKMFLSSVACLVAIATVINLILTAEVKMFEKYIIHVSSVSLMLNLLEIILIFYLQLV